MILTEAITVNGINLNIIIYVLLGVVAALIALVIVLLIKTIKLEKKYATFMKGSDGENLESSIFSRFKEIDKLKKEEHLTSEKLDVTCETLINAFQKMGMIKYDAFSEMGGKLSFSLCLLTDKDNGFILSSIHSREGCHIYVKEIIRGESYVILSAEERKALESAQKGTNFTDIG